MEITPLRTIVPFSDKYMFRVRISRIWRPRLYNREDYDGLHYVLIDENGDSIHALISEDQHDDMTEEVEPGQIYDIYRFVTREDSHSYRVLENDLAVHFNGATQFVKLDEIPIPKHSFRLIEFEQLEEQQSNEILTDFYGCIKTVRAPHQQVLRTKKKVETKCDVTVQNLRREILKITLWGDIARSFDIDTLQRSPPPALAVFTSLIIGQFDKRVVASSSNHTCIFFNPAIPMTDEYMLEFSKTGDKVDIMGTISNYRTAAGVEQQNRITVSELNALNPQEYMNKTVYCSASIRRFSPNGWWYRSCSTSNCYKQLQKDEEEDNDYFCPLHGLQKPQPYYRVKMIIEDTESQATLTLMGRQAEEFFNSKCEQLLQKRFYPTEQLLPEEIVDKVGQTHLFEIKVNQNGDLMVRSITLDTLHTPDHPHTQRKKLNETKFRREAEEAASSSLNMQQKRKNKTAENE